MYVLVKRYSLCPYSGYDRGANTAVGVNIDTNLEIESDLGSAPASSRRSTNDDPASQSDFDSPLTKRIALCSGVSPSKRSIGSTSRPSWSSRWSSASSARRGSCQLMPCSPHVLSSIAYRSDDNRKPTASIACSNV